MHAPFVQLLLVALAASSLAVPLARAVGTRAGLLDHPQARKMQRSAVPRTGGIGILCAMAAGCLMLWHLAAPLGVPLTPELLVLLGAAVLIHLTGLLDDLQDLSAGKKLLAHALIVSGAALWGVRLERIVWPGGEVWELGILSFPLTVFFLLGFINAINLADGLDGLAGGISAIGALALAILGIAEGDYVLASLASILLGAVLGFLPFNLRHRKTFLGDGGSTLLGYMLGAVALAGARSEATTTPVFVVMASAAIPILDTATTILRRSRRRQKLFRADSMHIHHRLLRFGLSPRRAVLAILAITLSSAGLGLALLVEGMGALLVVAALGALLASLQLPRRQPAPDPESDASFREILFYLLGAREGRGPWLDGELALAEVVASHEARPGTRVATAASSPEPEPQDTPVRGASLSSAVEP